MSDRVAIVNEMFDALGDGDVDRMTALFTSDIVVREAENLPFAGDHIGVEAIRTNLLGKMQVLYDLVVKDREVVQAGDRVLVALSGEFTSRATGRTVSMPMLELYSFKDDRICEIDVYYKDTTKISALLSER